MRQRRVFSESAFRASNASSFKNSSICSRNNERIRITLDRNIRKFLVFKLNLKGKYNLPVNLQLNLYGLPRHEPASRKTASQVRAAVISKSV